MIRQERLSRSQLAAQHLIEIAQEGLIEIAQERLNQRNKWIVASGGIALRHGNPHHITVTQEIGSGAIGPAWPKDIRRGIVRVLRAGDKLRLE